MRLTLHTISILIKALIVHGFVTYSFSMTTLRNENRDERGFIHDLSTPLGAALLLADSIIEDLQDGHEIQPDDLLRLGDLYRALEEMNRLVALRKQTLLDQESIMAGAK
jgi:hypothetical protein